MKSNYIILLLLIFCSMATQAQSLIVGLNSSYYSEFNKRDWNTIPGLGYGLSFEFGGEGHGVKIGLSYLNVTYREASNDPDLSRQNPRLNIDGLYSYRLKIKDHYKLSANIGARLSLESEERFVNDYKYNSSTDLRFISPMAGFEGAYILKRFEMGLGIDFMYYNRTDWNTKPLSYLPYVTIKYRLE